MKVTATLKALVIQEAKNLKKHATEKEVSKLDINSLMPHSPNRCIYGQMTRHCFSDRAGVLIKTCATRVYGGGLYKGNLSSGAPLKKRTYDAEYFSPIEVFITIASTNQKEKLIKFLRDETKTLRL